MTIRKRPRRHPQFALPTLFTVGTLFCGYYTLVQTIKAVALLPHRADEAAALFDYAAIAIGIAMLTDGLDGRIARLTNSTSKFGGELDSLADCITFGAGPALLAFAWGMRGAIPAGASPLAELLPPLGYFCTFLYLTCAAARLARFNVQTDPQPKNPGPSHRRYFVGIPSPPSAGLLGAVRAFLARPSCRAVVAGRLAVVPAAGQPRAADDLQLALPELQGAQLHAVARHGRFLRQPDLLGVELLSPRAADHGRGLRRQRSPDAACRPAAEAVAEHAWRGGRQPPDPQLAAMRGRARIGRLGRLAAPAAACLAATLCCGYRVAGTADLLPARIRTIAVPAFTNATSEFKIEQYLTDAVVREVLSRTRYHVVSDDAAADATLVGAVALFDASLRISIR